MLVTFFVFIYFSLVLAETSLVVELPNLGRIEGYYGKSLDGNIYIAFEGVPYARPPVGKYRFEKPAPPKPWRGTYQAKTKYSCMQKLQYAKEGEEDVIGDEDCLYMNIYTPETDPDTNLDVIVYIQGATIMSLYSNNGPHYIMNRNIVYVTLNFRLGPLGFLSTESNVVSGNNGFEDQILALKFIKKYIKNFGGDPDSITIMGTSDGAASVHLHYISPKSKGLFNRGISQSGTVLNPWFLMEKPLEKCKKLATLLKCNTANVNKMIKCLKKRPASQITAYVSAFQPWLYNPFSPFGIVVDSWNSHPVLPDEPIKLIREGKVQDLPWIASETSAEGIYPATDYLLKPEYMQYINKNWNKLLPHILDYNFTVDSKLHDEVSQEIRHHFFKFQNLSKSNFPKLIRMISERLFLNGIHKAVELHSAVVTSPVYFYYFEYCGAKNWHQKLIGRQEGFGSAHAEDAGFFLSSLVDVTSAKEDREMVDFFVNVFSDYANTGVPYLSSNIIWKPVSKMTKEIHALKIYSSTNLSWAQVELKNKEFWGFLPIAENIVDSDDEW